MLTCFAQSAESDKNTLNSRFLNFNCQICEFHIKVSLNCDFELRDFHKNCKKCRYNDTFLPTRGRCSKMEQVRDENKAGIFPDCLFCQKFAVKRPGVLPMS